MCNTPALYTPNPFWFQCKSGCPFQSPAECCLISLAPLDLRVFCEVHMATITNLPRTLQFGFERIAARKYLLLVMKKRILKVGLSRNNFTLATNLDLLTADHLTINLWQFVINFQATCLFSAPFCLPMQGVRKVFHCSREINSPSLNVTNAKHPFPQQMLQMLVMNLNNSYWIPWVPGA